MADVVWLTTIDNPWNPFERFDEWLQFDIEHKYYTSNYLARIARTSDSLSDEENHATINAAIDEILAMNINGLYTKVVWKPKEGDKGSNGNNEGNAG